MRRISAALPTAGLFLLVLAVTGCQQLFTTSWGKELGLAQSSVKLPGNLGARQAIDLVAQAKANGDTALAAALVGNLASQIADAPVGSSLRTELQTAAASAAVVASGAGETLMSLLTDASSGATLTAADVVELVNTIRSGFTPEIVTALQYLDPNNPGGGIDPTTISSESAVNTTDYLIAAVVVAASSAAVVTLGDADYNNLTAGQITILENDPTVQAAKLIALAGKTALGASGDAESLDLVDQAIALFGTP